MSTTLKEKLSNAASVVREAGRSVRRNFSTEYVHTTIEGVVDDLEERYPRTGKGKGKLRIARILLSRIFGNEYVNNEWDFVKDLIGEVVEMRK